MRHHHLTITTLEEHEPNREFVGRNFNAGEVIQLVLKSPYNPQAWLPFDYVQMVMMHELAHCKHMNHSRAFWAVRNQFASEMRELWAKGYTGEGIWGRGRGLGTGEFERNVVGAGEQLPEHLCGGMYVSRPKRKRRVLSWKERKERRILKKFGEGGQVLGEDEGVRKRLEKKSVAAKPRVANSARGRELRAAAALARFEQQKKEEEKKREVITIEDDEDEEEEGSETESGEEYADAIDINGKVLLDSKGGRMVRVCEDEDLDDADANNELEELRNLGRRPKPSDQKPSALFAQKQEARQPKPLPTPMSTIPKALPPSLPSAANVSNPLSTPSTQTSISVYTNVTTALNANGSRTTNNTAKSSNSTCPICSFSNEPGSATCSVCAHVLDTRRIPDAWACTSVMCRDSQYRNAGDCGVCGVCGERKPKGGSV